MEGKNFCKQMKMGKTMESSQANRYSSANQGALNCVISSGKLGECLKECFKNEI